LLHAGPGGQESDLDIEWPIHKDVSIYTLDDSAGRTWIEYVVRFTHDRVEWIRPREEVPPPPEVPPLEWVPLEFPPKRADNKEETQGSLSPGMSQVDTEDAAATGSEEALLANIRRDRNELEKLLEECSSHWGYEDPVYRFYHQSFKVYWLQQQTESIVQRLQALSPDLPLNSWFVQIVESGTGKEFKLEDNARWMEVARPILEAFFHARFFLEMAVRYANLPAPPQPLPSGYAALLYLFRIR